jgi:hypothetical protein
VLACAHGGGRAGAWERLHADGSAGRRGRTVGAPAAADASPRRAPALAAFAAAAAAEAPAFKGDLLNKSYYPTSADASNSTKRWYIIDAQARCTLGGGEGGRGGNG